MSAEVCIEHDRGVGVGHVGPALEHRVVLVDDGTHHRADVERLLPVRVGFDEKMSPTVVKSLDGWTCG